MRRLLALPPFSWAGKYGYWRWRRQDKPPECSHEVHLSEALLAFETLALAVLGIALIVILPRLQITWNGQTVNTWEFPLAVYSILILAEWSIFSFLSGAWRGATERTQEKVKIPRPLLDQRFRAIVFHASQAWHGLLANQEEGEKAIRTARRAKAELVKVERSIMEYWTREMVSRWQAALPELQLRVQESTERETALPGLMRQLQYWERVFNQGIPSPDVGPRLSEAKATLARLIAEAQAVAHAEIERRVQELQRCTDAVTGAVQDVHKDRIRQ